MWRRLVALTHPDRGGDHDLFIWARALFEYVAGDHLEDPRASREKREQRSSPHPTTGDRLDYSSAYDRAGSFAGLTRLAVALADEVPEPYARLLEMLDTCREAGPHQRGAYFQQHQGATYRTLAAIGHAAGLDGAGRARWYEIAESVPLSQRHAGHILSRLRRE